MFRFLKPAKLPPLSDSQAAALPDIWVLAGYYQGSYFGTLKDYQGAGKVLEDLGRFIARKNFEYAANPEQHLIDVASITGLADPKQIKTILDLYKMSVFSIPMSELAF